MIIINAKDYFKGIGFIKLTEVQRKIKDIKDKNILIISPCGSGKTEASHSKLLEWGKKSIFIQPQKTLATSIYNRLNEYHKILNLDKWTIQHSSIEEDRFLQNKYCVTTIDQVLSGYLGIGKQAIMKGKNVITSNLVFDEVQLFDTEKMLLTTINMLDDIYKLNNNFIIMTATMPEYLINFLKDRYDMEVIICKNDSVENRKVKLNYIEELNINNIENYSDKQIIICNTQKQQCSIYNKIKDKDRVIVLNSKFLKTDRKNIEEKVDKYFSKHSMKNNKILLTTQIVEAGMDISADIVYTASCPIDNLVQRAGRCSRWGGDGQVIVFNSNDKIYNMAICKRTNDKIKQNQGIIFDWSIQKEWINEILNNFYEEKVHKNSLKLNKLYFKQYNRNNLIRDIENVNVIVDKNISINSFKKESIGIHINNLKRIAKTNKLYILNKKEILETTFNQIEIGETVVIDGNDCVYDELGFRYLGGNVCNDFKYYNEKNGIKFNDYVKETWLHHSISVRDLLKERIKKENFKDEFTKNRDKISNILGLHDLGKLDIEWLEGTPMTNEPLAHFPFQFKTYSKNRNHAFISATVLKPYISNLLYNVILQHHRRYAIDDIPKGISEYKLHNTYKKLLKDYGLHIDIKDYGKNILIKNKDVMTPENKSWTDFLYLTGLFMEVEIEAISTYIKSQSLKD